MTNARSSRRTAGAGLLLAAVGASVGAALVTSSAALGPGPKRRAV